MSRAVTSVPRQFIHKEKTIVKNIIVITGASSGFGALAARAGARRPHRLRQMRNHWPQCAAGQSSGTVRGRARLDLRAIELDASSRSRHGYQRSFHQGLTYCKRRRSPAEAFTQNNRRALRCQWLAPSANAPLLRCKQRRSRGCRAFQRLHPIWLRTSRKAGMMPWPCLRA